MTRSPIALPLSDIGSVLKHCTAGTKGGLEQEERLSKKRWRLVMGKTRYFRQNMVFPEEEKQVFRTTYGIFDGTVQRFKPVVKMKS